MDKKDPVEAGANAGEEIAKTNGIPDFILRELQALATSGQVIMLDLLDCWNVILDSDAFRAGVIRGLIDGWDVHAILTESGV